MSSFMNIVDPLPLCFELVTRIWELEIERVQWYGMNARLLTRESIRE